MVEWVLERRHRKKRLARTLALHLVGLMEGEAAPSRWVVLQEPPLRPESCVLRPAWQLCCGRSVNENAYRIGCPTRQVLVQADIEP